MTDTFIASNGYRIITPQDAHNVSITVLNRNPFASASSRHELGKYTVEALREFFQHERDTELGRWRWPENPEFVVYPPREGFSAEEPCDLFIVNEAWGSGLAYLDEESASYDEPDMPFVAAARAYFDAYPEPKPWHDAQPGEAWVITAQGGTCALLVADFAVEGRVFADAEELITYPTTSPDITAGRRIFPEVTE